MKLTATEVPKAVIEQSSVHAEEAKRGSRNAESRERQANISVDKSMERFEVEDQTKSVIAFTSQMIHTL